MQADNRKEALQKAIDHFGGVDGLAKALGIERQAIYMWRGRCPAARSYQIELLTKGKIKAGELHPPETKRRNGKAEARP